MTGRPSGWPRLLDDERGIIVASLIKLVVGLAIAGFVLMEAWQILFARISVQDLADRAAAAAASAYDDTGSVEEAREAAEEVVSLDDDARIKRRGGFVVNPTDRSVHVVIRKRASTLLVDEIGFLEEFTIAVGESTGHPPV